ncbi:uncharacterized protein DUF397 [Stackebrandtia endophytica]|uniref:Uncharacterized protein DUF397 n=1 Tax=Stackebrandtia endophytica TaxID=1496996 RepID=A0A543B2I7_9ACTN|nr:DUF397 domain-containing protein [Stackebrandtia endophytica]TQL79054.1 uncharacterized protein DUF397 [Stackebrandtia endophytica]
MKSPWRKSSRSGGQGNCVEARLNHTPEVRDSKMGDDSPILRLSPNDFTALLNSVKLQRLVTAVHQPVDRCFTFGGDRVGTSGCVGAQHY